MNIFFISDTHFGHEAPCTKFKREDGSPLRPFSCAAEADEFMVDAWNKTVSSGDKVYHLGDVTMSTKSTALQILSRLKGEKILIKGNHDLMKASQYLGYFKDIRACHQFGGLILTHIPIHSDSLSRWKLNVHGHLHANKVMKRKAVSEDGLRFTAEVVPDPRYFNVSVECINYTPIPLEEVRKYIKE